MSPSVDQSQHWYFWNHCQSSLLWFDRSWLSNCKFQFKFKFQSPENILWFFFLICWNFNLQKILWFFFLICWILFRSCQRRQFRIGEVTWTLISHWPSFRLYQKLIFTVLISFSTSKKTILILLILKIIFADFEWSSIFLGTLDGAVDIDTLFQELTTNPESIEWIKRHKIQFENKQQLFKSKDPMKKNSNVFRIIQDEEEFLLAKRIVKRAIQTESQIQKAFENLFEQCAIDNVRCIFLSMNSIFISKPSLYFAIIYFICSDFN